MSCYDRDIIDADHLDLGCGGSQRRKKVHKTCVLYGRTEQGGQSSVGLRLQYVCPSRVFVRSLLNLSAPAW